MNECGVCLKKYNEYENKLILLICGDTLCLRCINYYKEALRKDVFECRIYGTNTKSTGVIKMMAYKKDIDIPDIPTSFLYDKFEILIKCKNGEKYSFKVTKTMTIGELKDKIKKEIGINKDNYELVYKRPLLDLSKTLEYYGINKTETLIMISNFVGGCSGSLKEINIKFINFKKN